MTESKICTCPSGDGSLRWPCPAHPAVDQADVAAKLTFINGRPAMCGCQVEYSDGGGEYSDVIYVTLCAKHSGSAILDLVATNRIALTPEYEGQWHADLYLDREIPLAKVEGATPAEAVLALMSAERIDPEQESVEQAGGDERAAFERAFTVQEGICFDDKRGEYRSMNLRAIEVTDAQDLNLRLQGWQARAALAQPSPAQAKQAERPEVVASVVHSNPVVLGQCGPLNANDELMTVAQHAASVARWAEMFNRVEQQRDAALAEVERLRGSKGDPVGSFEKCMKVMYERDENAKRLEVALARVAELEKELGDSEKRGSELAASYCDGVVGDEYGHAYCHYKSERDAVLASFKNFHRLLCERFGYTHDEKDWQRDQLSLIEHIAVAQAQHSAPEGWMLVPVEPTEDVLDAIHNGGYVGDDQELRWFYQSILAAAPAPGGE
ncbi:TPA: hypothetical protein L4729_005330 [Pseudomonas aeruginosa]|uniref:hypothetical protein n=1 Tax=Pseudomonas aeruginosa TaxID=287 RepID=UPI000E0A8B6F|nr:hypothetical protein [Pseudomonas aeruginosa]HBO6178420.1 hypothetical protein [Pseudomonas aeruginosa]